MRTVGIDKRRDVDALLAPAEWCLPAWRLLVVFSTAATFARHLDTAVALVLVVSAGANLFHLWIARRGHGVFLWGGQGLLVDFVHSFGATIAIGVAFPRHDYLSQPATVPYLNYAAPLVVVWIIRRYLVSEGRQPAAWVVAIGQAVLLVAVSAGLVVALGSVNGYSLEEIPVGDVLGSAAWLGAALPLAYGIVRVVQRLTAAGLADMAQAQETFERWVHKDVTGQLDLVADELDQEVPDVEKLRGKVKQIRAAAAAERLQLDSHSKERAVAMMTRNAVLAYGGDVPIHPSPMGGWTVKGKSAELFQRTLAELILNVNRHANATHATIDIDWRLHRFVVRIEDNGKGLSPDDWASEATSLHRLRNDLSRVGGSLTYKRGRLGGACLEAEIPVEVQ